jgi:hypothetical protein
MSGGDLVLVRESAEDLLPADPVLGEVDLRWPGVSLSGCELAEGAVRPGGVVVLKVFGQDLAQMMLIDDQQPVQEFPAQGTDDSLADRARSGRVPTQNSSQRGELGILSVRETLAAVCGRLAGSPPGRRWGEMVPWVRQASRSCSSDCCIWSSAR